MGASNRVHPREDRYIEEDRGVTEKQEPNEEEQEEEGGDEEEEKDKEEEENNGNKVCHRHFRKISYLCKTDESSSFSMSLFTTRLLSVSETALFQNQTF